MTRAIPPALAAGLLVAVACAGPAPERGAPAATAAPEAPLVVEVVAAAGSGPEGDAWAKELREAVGARAGELRLASKGGAADILVRIEKLQRGVTFSPEPPGEGETQVVHGSFVLGHRTRAFMLGYRGEARPQAEALARNLRAIAKAMSAHDAADSSEPVASR
jgi:hypothetical protein